MSGIDESFCKLDYYIFIYYSTWSSLQEFCLLSRNRLFKEQFFNGQDYRDMKKW